MADKVKQEVKEEQIEEAALAEFRDAFCTYGTIAIKDLGKMVLECERFLTDGEVKCMIIGYNAARPDSEGSVTISFREFEAMVAKIPKDSALKGYKGTFNDMDKDGNGYITFAELKKYLKYSPDDYLESLLKRSDFDNDGQISFDEYVKMRKGYRKDPEI